MSDTPGASKQCLYNANLISQHEVLLTAMDKRLDRMEHNQNNHQKEISEKVGEVREKLFDGYDTKISNTNERVTEIATTVKEMYQRGGVDQNQIENIVHRKMDEREMKIQSEKRWLKTHRVEVLSGFMAVCMVLIVIITYFRG